MALLDIEKLTIRFGGLTAVNKVDVRVEEGRIFSIIGPNGAGKTTVFNGITALYEPTEGAIRFRGQPMERALTAKVVAACVLVGLLMGIGAAIVSTNVDKLWRAMIKQNYRDSSKPFPVGKACGDFWTYMEGGPRLEQRGSRWHVVTHAGERSLASSPKLEDAQQRLENAREMIALEGSPSTVEQREGKWVVLSRDRTRAVATFDSREEAVDKLKNYADIGGESRAMRVTAWIALVLGLLVGGFGAFSVWHQTRRTPHIVAAYGLARTFQNIRLFQEMSALENVLMGMDRHLRPPRGRYLKYALPAGIAGGFLLLAIAQRQEWFASWLQGLWALLFAAGTTAYVVWISRQSAFSRNELEIETEARRKALELLEFVGLAGRAGMIARNLPYGDQRRLEIARALATRPSLLLLDEPAAGMNPAETGELMKLIHRIRDSGVTVLLIEHHMKVVMGISDRIAVLDYGSKIAEGTAEEVKADPKVIEAYLGKEDVG